MTACDALGLQLHGASVLGHPRCFADRGDAVESLDRIGEDTRNGDGTLPGGVGELLRPFAALLKELDRSADVLLTELLFG